MREKESDLGYLCNHKKNCKVCSSLKDKLSCVSLSSVEISQKVKESGKYNFECCRIPVNEKMDTEFFKKNA